MSSLWWVTSDAVRMTFHIILIVILLFIADIDRRSQRIFLFPVACVAVMGLILQILIEGASLLSVFFGICLGGLFFGIQYFLSRGKAIGVGDVFLGIALGCTFGVSRFLFILLLAYVGGAIIALLLLATKRIKRTDPLPLGAFLALAAIIVLFIPHPWILFGYS